MLESKVVWFISAFLLQLVTGLAVFKDMSPSGYQWIVVVIGGLAQGFVAWRAFVQKPPE